MTVGKGPTCAGMCVYVSADGECVRCAAGFDPDVDLDRIGLANQTTMLRDETLEIGKLLEKAMMTRHGPAELKKHYMVLDTICDATQVPPLLLTDFAFVD